MATLPHGDEIGKPEPLMSAILEDGIVLLDEISALIRRFVVLTPAQADLCALWILHTYVTDAADFTPYLDINSPVRRAGKSRLLEVLALLVHKPWLTGRVTGAVLIRKTSVEHPTLLLDESDAAFHGDREYAESLRGILNTGFDRDGQVSLCVPAGNDWVHKDFSTFSAKAIAGIGKLPQTVKDRSISIHLKRKLRHESCERFRKRKVKPETALLRERILKWARQNLAALTGAEPALPEELNDRQQDVCEPLLAVADLVGGEWPRRTRRALLELCTGQSAQEESIEIQLLADIRLIFEANKTDRLPTQKLLTDLSTIEVSPWAEFEHGCVLTGQALAKLLRPFGIGPRDIRFEAGTKKGYIRNDFEDAWERYLSPPAPTRPAERQQGQQRSIHADPEHFLEGQQKPSVADGGNGSRPVNMRPVADVAPFDATEASGKAHGPHSALPPTVGPTERATESPGPHISLPQGGLSE